MGKSQHSKQQRTESKPQSQKSGSVASFNPFAAHSGAKSGVQFGASSWGASSASERQTPANTFGADMSDSDDDMQEHDEEVDAGVEDDDVHMQESDEDENDGAAADDSDDEAQIANDSDDDDENDKQKNVKSAAPAQDISLFTTQNLVAQMHRRQQEKEHEETVEGLTSGNFDARREVEKKGRGYVGIDLERIDENKLAKFEEERLEALGIGHKAAGKMQDAFHAELVTDTFSNVAIEQLTQAPHNLNEKLVSQLHTHMNLQKLTVVQSKTLAPVLAGKDVLVSSETGSGKTLAYLIPIVQKLVEMSLQSPISRDLGTLALILAPTRELCIQIHEVAKKLTQPFASFLVSGLLIGGEKTKSEKARLRKGVNILIATPGRLAYHLQNTEAFQLGHLKYIVLDEADGLLDLGEEDTIKNIFIQIGPKLLQPVKPQSILVSATMNMNIRELASFTLKDEVVVGLEDVKKKIKAKKQGDDDNMEEQDDNDDDNLEDTDVYRVPAGLTQHYIVAPKYLNLSLLVAFLRSKTHADSLQYSQKQTQSKILVFFSSADPVEFYHLLLTSTKLFPEKNFTVPILKLHADMPQDQRTKAYQQFKTEQTAILLTTDIAARGLDFPGVDWIVQYDPPGQPKEYLHRIGRTGRLGAGGNALMLLSENEILYLKLLEKLGLNVNRMNGTSLFEHLAIGFGDSITSRDPRAASDHLMNIVATTVAKNKEAYQWAVASFLSYVRSYTSHYKDTRYIFHAKNLRLDHVKRMYGLSEKATFLLKQKPKVGRIMDKLNVAKNVQTDLASEVAPPRPTGSAAVAAVKISKHKPDSDLPDEVRALMNDKPHSLRFAASAEPSEDAMKLESDDEDDAKPAQSEAKPGREKVNIIQFLDKKRARLEQTKRKLPPIRLPEEVKHSESYKKLQDQRQATRYTISKKDFDQQHLYGRIESKSQKNKLMGETLEGSSKDERKKRKFSAHMEKAFLEKGRTSVPDKMVNRNPFDVRGQNRLFEVMTGLTSEFDDGSSRLTKGKRRKLNNGDSQDMSEFS